jgi:hypothetical protein
MQLPRSCPADSVSPCRRKCFSSSRRAENDFSHSRWTASDARVSGPLSRLACDLSGAAGREVNWRFSGPGTARNIFCCARLESCLCPRKRR